MTNKRLGWIIALVSLALGTFDARAAVVLTIDDFSTDQLQQVTGASGCDTFDPACTVVKNPDTQASGTGILGGYRDVFIEKTGPSGTTVAIGPGILGGNDWMAVSNDALTTSDVVVIWDGANPISADPRIDANIDTAGLGGIDFTPTPGSHGILMEVIAIDLDVTATLSLWDTDGDLASVSYTFTASENHTFQFSDFLADNALLDLDRIGAVRLWLTGPEAWDGVFDLVGVVNDPPTPVPAPMPVALLGFGLLMTVKRRRG